MMLTEAQAREAWCPFAQVTDCRAGVTGYNRVIDREGARKVSANAMCLGSQCMAWRWSRKPKDAEYSDGSGKNPFRGYCGLADQP